MNVEPNVCSYGPVAKEIKKAPTVITESDRRMEWENGRIDYRGKDAFNNILIKLNKSLK